MNWFKKFFKDDDSAWGTLLPGDTRELTEEKVKELLKRIADAYIELDTNALASTLSIDSEFKTTYINGDSKKTQSGNRFLMINSMHSYINTRTVFEHYNMAIIRIINSSRAQWLIDCLAKSKYRLLDGTIVSSQSDQKLTIVIENGYAVVSHAEIKQLEY